MAYVIGGLIENEHYNSFVQQVVEVVNDIHQGGTSEVIANFGYGQPNILKNVNDGDVVTALDWENLLTIIKNVAIYQDTTIPTLPTSIHTGDTIEIINDIQPAITAIITNRLNSENIYKVSTINGGALRDIRVGGFTDLVYHEFFASFDSWDHARYFFNTGGEIKFTPQFLTTSTSGINLNWKTLFNRAGSITFSHSDTISNVMTLSVAVLTPVSTLGQITSITIVDAGLGYKVDDIINISHPTGINATAKVSSVGVSGDITGYIITNAGTGYTNIDLTADVVRAYINVGFYDLTTTYQTIFIDSILPNNTLELQAKLSGESGITSNIYFKLLVNNPSMIPELSTGRITHLVDVTNASSEYVTVKAPLFYNSVTMVQSSPPSSIDHPEVTISSLTTTFTERVRHTDREGNGTPYTVNVTNINSMDIYDLVNNDPEYVTTFVNGVETTFKYVLDVVEDVYKMVVTNKSGTVTFYRTKNCLNRYCFINSLDVQNGATPFKFKYITNTISGKSIVHDFQYAIDDNMFSWENPIFLGDYLGSPEAYYAISEISILNGGTGYTIGDILVLSGDGATAQVVNVGMSNTITEIKLISSNPQYAVNDVLTVLSGSTGINATFTVVSVTMDYNTTQPHYGAHTIVFDNAKYVVAGAGENGFFVSRHNKNTGELDQTFGNNGVVTLALGQYSGGVVTKIIKARDASHQYAVIGYCVINGNKRGFIALLNNDGSLYTQFTPSNYIGYYIEPDTYGPSIYYDIEIDNPTNGNSEYVVLLSRMKTAESLYQRRFTSINMVSTSDIYTNGDFGQIEWASFVKYQYNLGIVVTPDKEVVKNTGLQSAIISNLGSSTTNELGASVQTITTVYDSIKTDIVETQVGDAIISYAPIDIKLDSFDGTNGIYTATHSDQNGQLYIAQTYSIGNVNRISYGIKIQRFISSSNGYVIDDTFANEYNSSNAWLSHVDKNATATPAKNAEVFVPVKIFTSLTSVNAQYIFVVGSYIKDINVSPTKQDVQTFVMKLDINGNSAPIIKIYEHGWASKVMDAFLHSDILGNVPDTRIVMCGLHKATSILNNALNNDLNNTPVNQGAFISKIYTVSSENIDELEYNSMSFGLSGTVYMTTDDFVDGNTLKPYTTVTGSQLGTDVAISADGLYAVAGAKYKNRTDIVTTGGVSVFKRNDSGFYDLIVNLIPPEEITTSTTDPEFGASIAISDDCSVILVGAPKCKYGTTERVGCVFPYVLTSENVWTCFPKFTINSPESDMNFGISCDISGDGKKVVIGAPNATVSAKANAGKAFIYNFEYPLLPAITPPVSHTLDSIIIGDTLTISDANRLFGSTVCISSKNYKYLDGYTIIASKPQQTVSGKVNAGAIDVFTSYSTDGSFILDQTLYATTITENAYFGKHCELDYYGTTIFCSDGNSTAFTVNSLQYELKYYSTTRDKLSKIRQLDIKSVDSTNTLIDLSCGHDGRTIAMGTSNSSTNQVEIYHKVGKDDPNLIIAGKYDEKYVYQSSLTTPTKFSPSDSSYSYGVVALAKYNNNLIVGSPNCDLTGIDRGDNDSLGKVYFYLAEDKKVDFTITGDVNAIENNKEQYINFASGLITITKNKNELSYEEFSIDGQVFTLAHDEQYSIQETSVGYISIEKVDDVKREWRYFPKWNRYNYLNGDPIAVNVELIYSTISYKLNRVTKSHTIAVIDGELQQTDVYVSSTIDNCELITDYNEIIEKGTNYLYSGFIKYNEGSDRISYSILNVDTVDATDNILDGHSITLNGGSQPQQVTCGAIDVAIQPSINGVDNIYSFSFQAKKVPYTIDGTTNCIFPSSADCFQMFNGGKLMSINCNPYHNAEKNIYDASITSYRFYVEGTHNRDIISKIVIVGKFSGTPDEETVTTLYPSVLYDGYRKVGTKYLDDDTYSINLDYTMYNFYVDNDSERLLPDETYVVKVYTNQNIAKVFAGSYKLNDRIQGVNSNNIVYPIGSLSCRKELSPSSILEVFSSGESFPTILGGKFDLYFTPQNDANKKSKITFTMEGKHPRNYINNLNIFGVFGKGFDKGNEYRVPDRTDPKQRNYTYESYIQLFTDGLTNTKSSNSVQDSITSDVDPLKWVTVPPVVTCIAETYPLCTNYEYVSIGGYTKWEWDCSQFRNTYGPFVKGRMYDVSVNHVSDISYLEGAIAYKFENQKRGYISYYNENKIYNETETTSILKNDGFNGVKIDSVYTVDGTDSINPKIVIEMRGKLPQTFINKVVISGAFVVGPALVVDFSNHTYELTSTNNSEEGYIPQEYVPIFSNFYYKKVRDSVNGKEFNEYVTVWEWEYTTSVNASKDTGTFRAGQNYTIQINDGIIDALTFGDKQTSAVAVERLYQYNISSGGHDGNSYYGYVNDSDIDKPHTIGSSATNAMTIGDAKILSFTSSPTINWVTGEVYGNVVYELQVEGTQAIDLFKTISIDSTGLTTTTKMFNSKYSKQNASQPLILSTNTIVGKYNGGKYYGNTLGIGLVRRRYQSTFTNQHTQLSDPKSISNKYTWDDSAVVRLFPSLNPVGDVCFLFESNKPFLHDFYIYEKNGKFRTVWQWVVGSPIYMPPTIFNANTIVPGKSMASGRTYKLTIDASDAASSTTTFGKTYIQKTSLMDSVTYGKEVYKPVLFNTRSTNSSMSLADRQDVSKFNIIANNDNGVYTWVNQVEGSINISPIINTKFGLKLEYMKLDQSNKSLEVKFSCTSSNLNIYGVIDRISLVNNGIEIYNGRLPTTSIAEDAINNITVSSDVNGRFLVAKMKVHEWTNISDDFIDLIVVSNKDENYTFNYHVIDDNSNPLLTHNGAIKLKLLSKQTDGDVELVSDEVVSAINLKFFSYYSVVGEVSTMQATDGYERYKYKLWYGIGPEDNVNDDITGLPVDWVRRSFMNKPLPFTSTDNFTFDIHTFPINGSEHIEYVIGAKGVITNDCITTISGQTSVSKHDSKVDFDETFRYRTGGIMPSKTDENKGVFRVVYVLFNLIKNWT